MYDILQLNDMLVPELLDIAEQLKIPNAKKLDKQGLIYKILDSQAIAGSKGATASDGKRKRIVKTSTSTGGSEEAVVESGDEEKAPAKNQPRNPAKKKNRLRRKDVEKRTTKKNSPKQRRLS